MTLIFSIIFLQTTLAQQSRYTVKGTIIDRDNTEALVGANVQLLSLPDSTFITGIQAADDGTFELQSTRKGKTVIKVSFIGFMTKVVTVDPSHKRNGVVDLGYIAMQSDSKLLAEAQVTAAAAKVQVSGDSIVFNASAYRVPQGSTLEALVKLLPGAQVDASGNITINGKTVNKILVDGKEFFLNDKDMAMKNIPVDMVDRIKSYDRKSDMARVTGIDDGEEETVLDLTVKKGMNNGWFGNVNAGAGTQHRYNGRAMINRFTDNLQASLVGNARNITERWGWNRSRGLNSFKEVGGNIATTSTKLETGGSVSYRYNGGDSWNQTSSQEFNAQQGAFRRSTSQDYSSNGTLNAQFRLEWKPDTMTNIIFRPNFTMQRNNGSSFNDNTQYNTDPDNESYAAQVLEDIFLYNHSRSQSASSNTNFSGELQANRKLNSRGRNLTLRVNGSLVSGDNQSLSAGDVKNYAMSQFEFRNRYNTTPSVNRSLSGQLTYSEPIADRTYLQFSYQYSYSYSRNDRRAQIYDSEAYQKLDWALQDYRYDIDAILDFMESSRYMLRDSAALSQFSEYRNYNQTISVQLRRTRREYNFSAGIDLLPQSSTLNYRYLGKEYPDVRRSVFNWAPRVQLRWNFDKHTDLQFRYNGRTQQPSMTNLLNITDDTNAPFYTQGNPDLKPSFTHTFRGNFHTFDVESQRSIFVFVNGNIQQNAISNKTTYLAEGGQITRPMNINGNWRTDLGLGYNTGLGQNKRYTVGTMIRTSYGHDVGFYDNRSMASTANADLKSVTRNFSLSGDLRTAYRNDYVNIELNGNFSWTNGRNDVNSAADKDNYDFTYGGRFEWTMPWGTELATDLNMSSRRGYASADMNTNELLWNASLSHSFLRGRVLTIKAEAFDILGQQSNISRTINSFRISDSRTNAVYQYCMFSAIYRFSLFGGRNAIGTGNDRSEQMWGGFPGGGRGPRGGGGGPRGGGMRR